MAREEEEQNGGEGGGSKAHWCFMNRSGAVGSGSCSTADFLPPFLDPFFLDPFFLDPFFFPYRVRAL